MSQIFRKVIWRLKQWEGMHKTLQEKEKQHKVDLPSQKLGKTWHGSSLPGGLRRGPEDISCNHSLNALFGWHGDHSVFSWTWRLCDKRPTVDGDQAGSGWAWGRVGWWGWPIQTENKEELKVFETNMSSEPCGPLTTAFILACYSLDHKRLSTSYYSNSSPHQVPTLEWRWKSLPY